jgi:hypothetical protein
MLGAGFSMPVEDPVFGGGVARHVKNRTLNPGIHRLMPLEGKLFFNGGQWIVKIKAKQSWILPDHRSSYD